ncbi:MAG: dienelactone hydrolase family protein [Acidimicrobiales bacterium]
MTDTTIETEKGPIRGHLAVPAGTGPAPGVVVLHEMFGLTPEMRAHADRLAGAGYLALAPDLYSWGNTARCIASTMLAMQRGHGRALDDIEAARAFLAGHERSTGAVGVIGFCMGGGLALVSAPKGGFAAAAPNYGMVPRHAEEALRGICPVVASFGERDWMLRGHPERLERALDALDVPHDVKVYPGATHGFMNPHGGAVPKASAALLRLHYGPDTAEDAWSRILDFFAVHLRGAA